MVSRYGTPASRAAQQKANIARIASKPPVYSGGRGTAGSGTTADPYRAVPSGGGGGGGSSGGAAPSPTESALKTEEMKAESLKLQQAIFQKQIEAAKTKQDISDVTSQAARAGFRATAPETVTVSATGTEQTLSRTARGTIVGLTAAPAKPERETPTPSYTPTRPVSPGETMTLPEQRIAYPRTSKEETLLNIPGGTISGGLSTKDLSLAPVEVRTKTDIHRVGYELLTPSYGTISQLELDTISKQGELYKQQNIARAFEAGGVAAFEAELITTGIPKAVKSIPMAAGFGVLAAIAPEAIPIIIGGAALTASIPGFQEEIATKGISRTVASELPTFGVFAAFGGAGAKLRPYVKSITFDIKVGDFTESFMEKGTRFDSKQKGLLTFERSGAISPERQFQLVQKDVVYYEPQAEFKAPALSKKTIQPGFDDYIGKWFERPLSPDIKQAISNPIKTAGELAPSTQISLTGRFARAFESKGATTKIDFDLTPIQPQSKVRFDLFPRGKKGTGDPSLLFKKFGEKLSELDEKSNVLGEKLGTKPGQDVYSKAYGGEMRDLRPQFIDETYYRGQGFMPITLGERGMTKVGTDIMIGQKMRSGTDIKQKERMIILSPIKITGIGQTAGLSTSIGQTNLLGTGQVTSPRIIQDILQRQRQDQMQDIIPILDLDTTQPPREIPDPFRPPKETPPKTPPEKTPPTTFKFLFAPQQQRVIKRKGYNVMVKKRGKGFVRVNEAPLPENAAFNLGADIVDNTVSKSFKIVRSGKPTQMDDVSFRPLQDKFRPTIGRTKLPRGTYVEKNAYAIDSFGEMQGITVQGIKAQRRMRTF